MHTSTISIPLTGGQSLECPLISLNTVIVGAGAAGLKCALRLQELGMKDVAVFSAPNRTAPWTSPNRSSRAA